MTAAALRVVVRFRGSRDPLVSFVSGSLLVHVAVLVSIALASGAHRRPALHEEAWVVGLAGPKGLPAGGGGGGGGRVATAKPASKPAGARLETRSLSAKKPEKTSKPETRKKTVEAPKPEAPRPFPAEPSKGEGAGGAASGIPGSGLGPGGGSGIGGSIGSVGAEDVQFGWYRASVIALLQSHWTRPVLEGVRQTLSVIVTFEVEGDGRVENVQVETSSGIPSLDRSAQRAVQDSSPLPPLPTGLGKPPFAARFEFRWSPGQD